MRHNRPLIRHATAALITLLSASLSACGTDSDPAGSASATETASNGDVFNDADIEFATDMIPHHAQAIQMVTLTQGRKLDPEVQQLANEIRQAQSPEVETMVDWLTAWDQEVPETSIDHANAGHEMEGMDNMPGMMSSDEMTALEDAPDSKFQQMWLEMMKEHHEGAIEMAQTEQSDGKFADAVDLAEAIETTQEGEIDTIEALLAD